MSLKSTQGSLFNRRCQDDSAKINRSILTGLLQCWPGRKSKKIPKSADVCVFQPSDVIWLLKTWHHLMKISLLLTWWLKSPPSKALKINYNSHVRSAAKSLNVNNASLFYFTPLCSGTIIQNVPRHFLSALCNLPVRQHGFNNKSLVQVLCDHISCRENRKRGWERERESPASCEVLSVFFFFFFPTLSLFKPPESSQLLVRVCVCVIPVVCAQAKLGGEAGGGGGWVEGSVWREKMWFWGGGWWVRSWALQHRKQQQLRQEKVVSVCVRVCVRVCVFTLVIRHIFSFPCEIWSGSQQDICVLRR